MKEYKSTYQLLREQLIAEGRLRVYSAEESTKLLIELNKDMYEIHKGKTYPKLMPPHKKY